ncbi:unnamed protein product [Soboliphyme baturini]|uniref:START domain-containing protein n=1 Tax=Soboliphyme baturini TaxID=241478 RepID=A0A183INK4_9BILA|nr:unnamed protein product [Soboliphyme baturini]
MTAEQAERELSKIWKDVDSFLNGTREWTLKRQLVRATAGHVPLAVTSLTLCCFQHGVSVYTTPSTRFKGRVYRADCTINMAAQKIFDLIHPTAPYRFMWDLNVERCDLISEVMPVSTASYYGVLYAPCTVVCSPHSV